MSRNRIQRTRALVAVLAIAGSTLIAIAVPVRAEAVSWVVSVGDSYISGEAGRWAGNADSSSMTDALGPSAYNDAGRSEEIAGCSRSKSAEIHIGTAQGKNLACSGAVSATQPLSPGHNFKPGLDFYNDGSGHIGQALALQEFAAANKVTAVAVSIGGNDFNFPSIVATCIRDFLTSPAWWKNYCNDDEAVMANFVSSYVAATTAKIKQALLNVSAAMAHDGYSNSSYSVIVQTYPSPIPAGADIRYAESGYGRQSTGGCGLWNADANWANATALPTINDAVKSAATQSGLTNLKIMDVWQLFVGHRLCETTSYKLEEAGLSSWTQTGAVNLSEWIEEIRTVTAAIGPYTNAESLHPNYWGQLALRNCLRQAYNGGSAVGGDCVTSGLGLNNRGEPITTLNPSV